MMPGLDGPALSLAALTLGAMGSGHCVAMCGGIACALGMSVDDGAGATHRRLALAGYQAGRLLSYSCAGAIAGAFSAAVTMMADPHSVRVGLHVFQATLFIALGLYLTGLWRAPLAAVEGAGLALWRRLGGVRRRLLPVRHPHQALAFGALWGWLPCGLVYSALTLALSAGSAAAGALTMLAFGAGTLPAMLLASVFGGRLMGQASGSWLRRLVGAVMLVLGAAMGLLTLTGAGSY
jgi:sulfite exporter TauE/SafE